MNKYQPLSQFLTHLQGDYWRPTFLELERLLGFDLPAGARKTLTWWSVDGAGRSGYAKSWLDTGWKAEEVSLEKQRVTFRRNAKAAETGAAEAPAPDARHRIEERARAFRSWADDQGHAAVAAVREKPLTAAGVSVGTAFAAGLVFGFLIGRPSAPPRTVGARALAAAGEGARRALPLIVDRWDELSERAKEELRRLRA